MLQSQQVEAVVPQFQVEQMNVGRQSVCQLRTTELFLRRYLTQIYRRSLTSSAIEANVSMGDM